jgi:hypothetical protein
MKKTLNSKLLQLVPDFLNVLFENRLQTFVQLQATIEVLLRFVFLPFKQQEDAATQGAP